MCIVYTFNVRYQIFQKKYSAYKIGSKSDITLMHLQKKDCIIWAQLAFQQLFNNQKNGQHISKFRVSSAIVRIPDINQSRAIKA